MSEGVYLEMTAPEQLQASVEVPELVLDEVSSSAAPTICELYNEIWEDGGRSRWSSDRWAEELSLPQIRTWVAVLGARPVGFAEVGWQRNGHVVFVVIGVVPSAQGRGIGGDLTSRLTRVARETPSADGRPTSRVWLWTLPDEHLHTIPKSRATGTRLTRNDGRS